MLAHTRFCIHSGLHQTDSAVRARVCYLFSRFLYQAKIIILAQVSVDVVRQILTGMQVSVFLYLVECLLCRIDRMRTFSQDLLVINAELPDSEPPSEAILTKAAGVPGDFESQLYLFESVGTLVSILNQCPPDQVLLLNAILDPLLAQLQQSVRPTATSPGDLNAVFTAHHLIMAIGNVAKGFPDLSARQPTAQGEWVQCFRKATEAVLASAKIMAGFAVIRDAVRRRSSFQSLSNVD